jgi:hypothetical protein
MHVKVTEGQFGNRISCHAPIGRSANPSIVPAWVRISSHRIALCLVLAACAATGAEVPSGTRIEIRLTTAIKIATAKVNDPVDAVVIAPVIAGSRVTIASGTIVHGEIKEAKQAVKPEDQAVVQIQFDRIASARGQKAPLSARLVGVDNARESVDEQGRILGIIAAQTGSGRLDQGIEKISQRYPVLGDILGAAKGAVVKETDPNIDYEPGVEMTIELTKSLKWEETAASPTVRSIDPADELANIVNQQPMRTAAERPPTWSDTTNIMFLSSREQLERAFQDAGWSSAEKLDAKSKLETFRAMTEGRGYKEAPVSLLLLDGRPPDLVFQKQNNTFARRHHLRIWLRPGTFNGKSMWVCAATHDIGIDFSQRDRTFIHKVELEIDRERAKVVSDLLFTGKVQALALVDRSSAPRSGQNATGDAFQTDGRMAVLEF